MLEKIGKYQILNELGKGATSAVYLGMDPFANRKVAIKVVQRDVLGDKEHGKRFRKLFLTEASLAGKLSHPHICAIFDAVADEEGSYLVMEYVEGGTLEPHTKHENLLSVNKIVEIIFKCSQGARLRPPLRRDPPRYQAGQYPAGQGHRHQDFGFRRGAHHRGRDHAGERHRLAGLHVARAGAGAAAHATRPTSSRSAWSCTSC